MSVLFEGLCLVIPNVALDSSHPGGSAGFIDDMSLCSDTRYAVTDGRLTVVSMFKQGVGVELLEILMSYGMWSDPDSDAVDSIFVDMETGTAIPCPWLNTLRHPHGFMVGWHSEGERGPMAAPGDWDASVSWPLERTDICDEPDCGMMLANEDGGDPMLDFSTGRIDTTPDVRSPVLPVGRATPASPADWELVDGLSPTLRVGRRCCNA